MRSRIFLLKALFDGSQPFSGAGFLCRLQRTFLPSCVDFDNRKLALTDSDQKSMKMTAALEKAAGGSSLLERAREAERLRDQRQKEADQIPSVTLEELLTTPASIEFVRLNDIPQGEPIRSNTGKGEPELVYAVGSGLSISAYCPNVQCSSDMRFDQETRYANRGLEISGRETQVFTFRCRHCRISTYEIGVILGVGSDGFFYGLKLGEYPSMLVKTPNKLLEVLGDSKELFLQGRRAEHLGLGLGAAVYYRRVLEDQKDSLLRYIATTLKETGGDQKLTGEIDAAIGSPRFAESVEMINSVLPGQLLITGQNPLKLLSNALGGSIHARPDAEFLAVARQTRQVLIALIKKLQLMRQEERELQGAVTGLSKFNNENR